MTLYHVTLMENVNSILTNGLIPAIGERSMDFGEKEKVVYLFPSITDMECALLQWLGDWYNEDVALASLEVEVPTDFPIEEGDVEYEVISRMIIPPAYIKFVKEV